MDILGDEDVAQTSDASGSERSPFDLPYYWSVLKRRWWVIVACAATVGTLMMLVSMRRPKIYEAIATVILDPTAPNVLGNQNSEVVELGSGNLWTNSEYYNTQVRVLRSYALARKVVVRYKLHQDPRFMPKQGGAALSEEALIDKATLDLQSRIKVNLVKDSRVFAIQVKHTNARLAADLANGVQTVFIDQNLEVKRISTGDAKDFVGRLLQSALSELEKSEKELFAFKDQNKLLEVSWEDRQNRNTRSLELFATALDETEKKVTELEARRHGIAKLLEADVLEFPSTLEEGSTIGTLRLAYVEAVGSLRALEGRYGPKHEQVIEQQARVNNALEDLRREAGTMLKALDVEVAALHETQTKYRAKLDELTAEALERNRQGLKYKELSRTASNAETVYTQLLTRWHESHLQEQDLANNMRPLDAAKVPLLPSEPNVPQSLFLGLALGFMLGVGLIVALEMLDRSIKSQEDVENFVGAPFLGMVPSVGSVMAESPEDALQPELYVARHKSSTIAEACRVIRTNILFTSPDKPLRTMLVTSSHPSEGKTMTVVNLGIVMSQAGHRTLMVDTDMRRPRLHKALRVPNDNGVSRLVVGETTLEAAIKSTEVPNLFLLPCGPIPPNPAEILATDRFHRVMEELASKFDRVIFDSPPVLAVTDAVVLSRSVDGCVLVVRAGRTARDAARRARQTIASVGSRIAGVVLNDVDVRNPHYAGYYNYYKYDSQTTVPAEDATHPS
jgi:succinoglycan biosynthesis transport protein ExoP